jgi:hypothetical protein
MTIQITAPLAKKIKRRVRINDSSIPSNALIEISRDSVLDNYSSIWLNSKIIRSKKAEHLMVTPRNGIVRLSIFSLGGVFIKSSMVQIDDL